MFRNISNDIVQCEVSESVAFSSLSPVCVTSRHELVMCLVRCPGQSEQKYLCTGKDRAVDKQMPIVSPTEASAIANSR